MICPLCNCQLRKISISSGQYNFYRCKECGYWTSRTFTGEIPVAKYDNLPDFNIDYDNNYRELVISAKKILAYKFRIVNMQKPMKFLDIGCSEGVYVAACKDLGWQARGFELDPAKVKRATQRGLDVQPIDILNYNDEPDQFEFVLLRHVIEHVPDFLSFVKEASRLVASDGVLCIETPNQSSLMSLLSRQRLVDGRYLGALYPPTHVHAFEKKSIQLICDKVGLHVAKLITYAPSDPRWLPSLMYGKTGIKPVAHRILSTIGFGNDISAFLRWQ